MKRTISSLLFLLPLVLSAFSPGAIGLVEIPVPVVGSPEWTALAKSGFQFSLDARGELLQADMVSRKPATLYVPGGFLYGVDEFDAPDGGGMFAGALSFVPDDPKKPTLPILRDNVKAILSLGGVVWVFAGEYGALHGGAPVEGTTAAIFVDGGSAHRLAFVGDAWKVEESLSLPGCPMAVAVEGTKAWIVTSLGLALLEEGKVKELLTGQYWEGLDPRFAKRDGELLLIGMRGSIASYDPASGAVRAYARRR